MKILVLGAGYSGLTVAHRIREFSKAEITVISNKRVVKGKYNISLTLNE